MDLFHWVQRSKRITYLWFYLLVVCLIILRTKISFAVSLYHLYSLLQRCCVFQFLDLAREPSNNLCAFSVHYFKACQSDSILMKNMSRIQTKLISNKRVIK